MADNCKSKLLLACEDWRACTNRMEILLASISPANQLRLCVMEDAVEAGRPKYCVDLGREVCDIEELLSDIRMLLLPRVSDQILKNLAAGFIRNPFEALIMEALCQGLPVLAFEPRRSNREVNSLAASSYLKGRTDLFAVCGIKTVTADEISEWPELTAKAGYKEYGRMKEALDIKTSVHTVITEEEILQLKLQGIREVLLDQGACITPLARDTAKEAGITVVRSAGKWPEPII